MEELGNLATGFEVDGGHLRHQLYIWLEKEVDVLSVLCDYGTVSASTVQSVNEGHCQQLIICRILVACYIITSFFHQNLLLIPPSTETIALKLNLDEK